MPICNKCQNHFPNKIKIKGKERVLNNRKYCLDCSPFNCHNTKQIHVVNDLIRKCENCDRTYHYDYKSGLGHTKKLCNSCMANRRKIEIKEKSIKYLGGKCSANNCGYNKCKSALEFHHLNPKEKEFTISGSHCYSWGRIKKELDKCILLCANCHREIESGIETLESIGIKV